MKIALGIVLTICTCMVIACSGGGQPKSANSAPQLSEQVVEDPLRDYKAAGLTGTTVGVEKNAVSIVANVGDDTDEGAWKSISQGIIDYLRSKLSKETIIMVMVYHMQRRVAVGVVGKGATGEEMKFKLDK